MLALEMWLMPSIPIKNLQNNSANSPHGLWQYFACFMVICRVIGHKVLAVKMQALI